jgi:hypothetical protein
MASPSGSSSLSSAEVARLLEEVRNAENGNPSPQAIAALERAMAALWSRITAQPDTYVMNRDEFAMFTYFRARYDSNPIAKRAVERFWNNYRGSSTATDGHTPAS